MLQSKERWANAVAEIKRLRAEVAKLLTMIQTYRTKCTCGACVSEDDF